jgi:hypothetical protein
MNSLTSPARCEKNRERHTPGGGGVTNGDRGSPDTLAMSISLPEVFQVVFSRWATSCDRRGRACASSGFRLVERVYGRLFRMVEPKMAGGGKLRKTQKGH